MTKAYYGNPVSIENTLTSLTSGSSDSTIALFRVDPAPSVTISVNYSYSGDNIIGYVYNIELNAILTSSSFGNVVNEIHHIEEVFSTYGGTLYITDNDYKILVKATGGIVKSLNFQNSNNSWSKTVPYTVSLEFQEVELKDARGCNNVSIDTGSFSSSIIDINQYKIKSFNDNWSFVLDEDMYNTIENIADNLVFNVSYNITATGQHYFVYDGTKQTVSPAWENARKFCTDRLYKQLTLLISQILDINASENCDSDELLSQIYKIPADVPLLDLGFNFYVFNEQITCGASESDGTFSVTYNATVKRATNNDYYKHTFKFNEEYNSSSSNLASIGQSTKTITVDGTIEGMVLGGLLYAYNGNFLLPANGRITNSSLDYNPKYSNALSGFNQILNGTGQDFNDVYKQKLGITFDRLNLDEGINFCGNNQNNYPSSQSFTVTQNINEGSISYAAVYSTDVACGQKYANISIEINKPQPIINTFIIPNGKFYTNMNTLGIGTVLQSIGANTNATMNISIQGRDSSLCCVSSLDITDALNIGTGSFSMPADLSLPNESNSILTSKSKNFNITTGSYTINLSYIICEDGCPIA
jgi:hypothetical protein